MYGLYVLIGLGVVVVVPLVWLCATKRMVFLELLVVIVIFSVLMAIAIPSYLGFKKRDAKRYGPDAVLVRSQAIAAGLQPVAVIRAKRQVIVRFTDNCTAALSYGQPPNGQLRFFYVNPWGFVITVNSPASIKQLAAHCKS